MSQTIQKLKMTINDAMQSVPGDLIDFRIYQGTTFSHLIAAAIQNNKTAYGIESFEGLPESSVFDQNNSIVVIPEKGALKSNEIYTKRNIERMIKNVSNYQIIQGKFEEAITKIPTTAKLSFGLVDLYQYIPTQNALNYLWDNLNFGGSIFIMNYNPDNRNGADLAITKFMEQHDAETITSRQMIVNGMRQNFIIIKCFNEHNKSIDSKFSMPVKSKLTVAMVLKYGGVYDYKYVNALANALRRNSTIDFEIAVLTDNSVGFNANINKVIPFRHNWPKWWGKIELFRPDLFEDQRVFFLDLDTVIVKNIDKLLNINVEFAGLRDFNAFDSLGSGLMAWIPSERIHKIYTNFVNKADHIINSYAAGDQRWIDENNPSITYFQDIFPNNVVSFKKNCLRKNEITIPPRAEIICFHGIPRPHTVEDELITMHWKP